MQIDSIEKLIDISEFKVTLDMLSKVLCIHIAVFDKDQNYLISSSYLPYCCEGFKNTERKQRKRCIHVDPGSIISCNNKDCYFEARIICVPIEVRKNQIGMFTACGFREKIANRNIEKIATLCSQELQIQETRFIRSIGSLPELSAKEIQEIGNYLHVLGEYIGELGYNIYDMALGIDNLNNELNTMFEMSAKFTSVSDTNSLLEIFVSDCVTIMDVESGFLLLWNEENDELKTTDFHNVSKEQADAIVSKLSLKQITRDGVNYSGQILDCILLDGFEIDRLLSVPIKTSDYLIGFIVLFDKEKRVPEFINSDRLKLLYQATLLAMAIDNLKKHSAPLVEFIKHLQPQTSYRFPICIGVKAVPRELATGDFYQFYEIDDRNMGFAIGDATGHGIPAAMQMVTIVASLGVLAESGLRVSKVLTELNKYICKYLPEGSCPSLFYGVLVTDSEAVPKITLDYCNAGHQPPILLPDGENAERLHATDILLGIRINEQYRESFVELHKGDILVLYTDGVTEAENTSEEQFGIDKLEKVICDNRHLNVQKLAEKIYLEVEEFTRKRPGDDITIIVVKPQFDGVTGDNPRE